MSVNQTVFIPPSSTSGLGPPGTSASPGYTWGRSGPINAGTFLLNDGVVSSTAGRIVSFNGTITHVYIDTPNSDTFTLAVMQRTAPATFSTLGSVSVVSAPGGAFAVSIPVTSGMILAVQCSAGTITGDCDVGVQIEQAA